MDLSAIREVLQKVPQWISSIPDHWKRIGVVAAVLFAYVAVTGVMVHRRIKRQAVLFRGGFSEGEQVCRKVDKKIGEITGFDKSASSYWVSFEGSARPTKVKPHEIEFYNN
jgi:hypothetical protein